MEMFLYLAHTEIEAKFNARITSRSSCKDIPENSPSGYYWIQAKNHTIPVQVYCDMMSRNCNCNSTGGWTRIANLDMTDPNQNCPNGFRLVNRTEPPLRLCGRPGNEFTGHVTATFPTHGIEYTHVCGRVIGYQFGSTDAFLAYFSSRFTPIDGCYVDGIILTHGQLPRQHVWTFAAALDEAQYSSHTSCPCIRPDKPFTHSLPPFIGQDYFCDAAIPSYTGQPNIFYPDNPLWDGQGCGSTSSCCEFNNPPWFCRQLPQPTTDDIELRICSSGEPITNEDTPLERIEIYVR